MGRSRNSNICGCHSSIEDMLKDIQSMSKVSINYDSESLDECIDTITRLENILYDIYRTVDFSELEEATSMWQRMEDGLRRRKEIMIANNLE